MTELPDYQFFMLPILEYLSDGQDHSMKDIRDHLAARYAISTGLREAFLPSGTQRIFDSRVGWAKTYIAQAGLVESPKRGVVHITARGEELLLQHHQHINLTVLERFPEFMAFRNKARKTDETIVPAESSSVSTATPEEQLETAFQTIRIDLVSELLDRLKTCDPTFFERLVVELLLKMGYGKNLAEAGKAIGRSGDEGIDGVISEDKLGLDSVYLQAKRWAGSVGRPEIHKFVGALHGKGARKGVFLTTGTFTAEAKEYAARLLDLRVVLIDGPALADYMIDYGLGVTTRTVYEIKRIDSDWFDGE
ncbi:MAG: restriction endonuclease [Acidithiobacillus sp.]